MDTKITKKIIEEFAESQGLSVAEFCRQKLSTNDTSYYRMLKDGTFKLKFIVNVANIIGISVDELIGRTIAIKNNSDGSTSSQSASSKIQYNLVLKQKDEMISSLQSSLKDKEKIISLLESERQYATVQK